MAVKIVVVAQSGDEDFSGDSVMLAKASRMEDEGSISVIFPEEYHSELLRRFFQCGAVDELWIGGSLLDQSLRRLVDLARDSGVPVVPQTGSISAALSLSGLLAPTKDKPSWLATHIPGHFLAWEWMVILGGILIPWARTGFGYVGGFTGIALTGAAFGSLAVHSHRHHDKPAATPVERWMQRNWSRVALMGLAVFYVFLWLGSN